jgi:hypothetical protein
VSPNSDQAGGRLGDKLVLDKSLNKKSKVAGCVSKLSVGANVQNGSGSLEKKVLHLISLAVLPSEYVELLFYELVG